MRHFTTSQRVRKPLSLVNSNHSKPKTSITSKHPRNLSGYSNQDDENMYLKIQPQCPTFQEIEPNIVYKMIIIVQNQSTQTSKIKIIPPSTKYFRLVQNPQTLSLAPGLKYKLALEFKADQIVDYHDSFSLVSQNTTKIIQLFANCPCSKIKYNSQINLDLIPICDTTSFDLLFENLSIPSKIVLTSQNKIISFIPPFFQLKEGEKRAVNIKLKPREEGDQHALIQVLVNNKIQKAIQVSFSAFKHQQFVLDGDNQLDKVEFGKLFYGKRKSIKLKIVNNTNKRTQFVAIFKRATNAKRMSMKRIESVLQDKLFQLIPNQKQLLPFQSLDVELILSPPMHQHHIDQVSKNAKRILTGSNMATKMIGKMKMTEEEFQYSMMIKFSQGNFVSPIFCTLLLPNIKLSATQINFGDITYGQRLEKILTVHNFGDISTQIQLQKIPSVLVEPKKLVLEAREVKIFKITLLSNTLGIFQKIQRITIAGIFNLNIQLSGNILKNVNEVPKTAGERSNRHISNLFRSTTRQNKMFKLRNLSENNKSSDFLASTLPLMPSVFNPKISLPQAKQGLFVIRPIDKYAPLKKSTKSLMVCKDRGKRTQVHNHRELSQIQMQISKQNLKQIECNYAEIDFGVMFMKSRETKKLQLINGLLTSIQVRLQTADTKYLQFSHQRTIISPEQKGSFQITFKAHQLGEIRSSMKYIINEKHTFQILLYAKIVPINLQVDKEAIKLSYGQSIKMDIQDSIVLRNPGNSSSQFSINNTTYCTFSLNQGILKPKQEVQIKLVFKPLQIEVFEAGERQFKSKEQIINYDEMALIKIKDGIDIPIKIMSQVMETRCSIKQTEINFDRILINQVKAQSFMIKNFSKSNIAVYEIQLGQLQDFCSIDHPKGKILPDTTKQIHVTFKIDRQIDLRSKLMVNFRGGNTIQLPILATTVVPYIQIQQQFLNFGTITVMSSSIIPITIVNNSQFNVDLMMDLTEPNAKDCLLVQLQEVWVSDEIIQFCLKPQQKRTFKLKFQSTKVKYHTFQIPLYLPGKVKTKSMVRNIQCNVQKTRLMIEPTEIRFQKAIISDEIVPALQVFRIQNTENRSIRWKLEQINPTIKSFKPQPDCGWLNSNQSTDVIMKFVPKKEGDIQSKFILKILDQTNSMYSNQLQVTAEGRAAYPKIVFDKKQVIMPVVPLSIESRACLKIINEGYTNIQLNYKLDTDENLKSLINVVFPEGKKIISGKTQLPVYVTFFSKAPISFSARLQIFDNIGKCYPIIVSGTSENSLLTCYPYLQQRLFYYTIYKKSTHQLMIEQFSQTEPLTKLNQFFLPEESSYKNVNEAILRWLKLTLCDDRLEKFPQSLIELKGQPIFKLIAMITNQREPIKGITRNTLQNYNLLLKYLKSHGCLLNHIRAYYLLNNDDYIAQLQLDGLIDIHKLHSEYTYWYKSNESWIILVFQIINVFKLDFFNSKAKFKGLQDRYSNIYSTQELGWIRWIETSLPQSQRHSVSITRLRDSFSDGYILGALIFQYLPNKLLLNRNLKPPPCKVEDIKHNFKQIKEMLKILNLYFFDGFNIQQFGDKEYIMFIRYLYSFLPSYIPKSEPLCFCCQVNQQVTKSIDITNSSNKPVSYIIRIIGNQDFTCNQSVIKIDGKKTYKLSVKYKCALWKQSRAFLMLTTKKQGLNVSAPCVFELVNEIIKKTRTKKLQPINCTLYESTLVRIDLDKLTATRQVTQYMISLRQEDQNECVVSGKYEAFSCDLDKVRIIKDIHSYIQVAYCPKSMKSSKCYISFSLEDKETYTFQLIGIPQMPKATFFKPSHVLYVRKPQTLQIPIPQPSPSAVKQLNELGQSKQQSQLTIKTNLNHELLNYITIPYQVNPKQKLKINIKSEHSIKDLMLDIILTNDLYTDVRRIKALINVIPEMVVVEQMKTTAGVTVNKQIYIHNPTQKDWKIQTKISHSEFSILNQRQFTIKKGGDHTIQINFHPSWVMVVRAKLQIFNVTTNQIIEYQLIGVSQEPLCQRTIQLKCKLRELETFMIPIQSPFDVSDYDVEIDLMGCHGHSTCTLNNQKAYYNLTVNPILTGTSNGSLIFYTKDRKYFWYKLIINTENGQTPRLLNVETTIGVPIELEIKIQNKSNSPDYFSIQLIGQELYGQPKLQAKPKETSNYKLIYSPTHQNYSKGQVIFRSIISGQQSYQLDLKAIKNTKPILLPSIQCQISKRKYLYIQIQNPLPESTPLSVLVNNKNFSLRYPDQVQAYSKAEIQITYKPTVVQEEECQIVVNPKKLGKKVYLQTAKATNVCKKQVIDFKCLMNQQDSKIIQFKQSSYENLKVFLQDDSEGFQVKQVYENNKIINILVIFKPVMLKQFSTNLNITIGGKPAHVYELKGHVEMVVKNQQKLIIQGKSRTKTIKYLDVFIKQVSNPHEDTFSFEIKNLPDYINKVTNVKLMNNQPLVKDGLLRFEFKIQPQKQYYGSFEVHMYRNKGGLWIFKVGMEIQPPISEGLIEVSTKIKTLGMGHLSLGNFPITDSKYQCNVIGIDKQYFDVSPGSGLINQDTKIKVEFEPTKLLKSNYSAVLDIISENYQKRYQLKGIVPVYHPPKKGKKIEFNE